MKQIISILIISIILLCAASCEKDDSDFATLIVGDWQLTDAEVYGIPVDAAYLNVNIYFYKDHTCTHTFLRYELPITSTFSISGNNLTIIDTSTGTILTYYFIIRELTDNNLTLEYPKAMQIWYLKRIK